MKKFNEYTVKEWLKDGESKLDNYFIYVRCAVYNNQKEYILCRILDVGKQFMGFCYIFQKIRFQSIEFLGKQKTF